MKTQIVGKLRRVWKVLMKIELFYYFLKICYMYNRAIGNNLVFLRHFFGFGGFPLSPCLRPCIQEFAVKFFHKFNGWNKQKVSCKSHWEVSNMSNPVTAVENTMNFRRDPWILTILVHIKNITKNLDSEKSSTPYRRTNLHYYVSDLDALHERAAKYQLTKHSM